MYTKLYLRVVNVVSSLLTGKFLLLDSIPLLSGVRLIDSAGCDPPESHLKLLFPAFGACSLDLEFLFFSGDTGGLMQSFCGERGFLLPDFFTGKSSSFFRAPILGN